MGGGYRNEEDTVLNAIKLGGVLHIRITCRTLKTIKHSLRGGAQVIPVSSQGGKLCVSKG